MGWRLPVHDQWLCVTRLWFCLANMNENRLNKKVFLYSMSKASRSNKNWCYKVMEFYRDIQRQHLCHTVIDTTSVVDDMNLVLFELYEQKWHATVNRDNAQRGEGRNKLRTYKLFKNEFLTEMYVKSVMSRNNRSALAKFRCGVAPLNIEIGRYTGTPEAQRICPTCNTGVEDEFYVLMQCSFYTDLRQKLIQCAINVNDNFVNFSHNDQFCYLLSHCDIVNNSAKILHGMLMRRRSFVFK